MIFQRSLVRELYSLASVVFVTLLTIVLTIALVRFLGQAANGRIANESVIAMILFSALHNIPVLLQLTAFIAVMLAVTRSARESEMVVWMSSGIGVAGWIRPVSHFAVPVALAVAVMSFFVTPWADRQTSEFKARFEQRTDATRVTPGQFRESDDGTRVAFVEGLSQDSTDVGNIFVSSLQQGVLGVMVSQSGRIERQPNGDDFLVMFNGRRYEGDAGFPNYKIMDFERYGVRIEKKAPVFDDASVRIKSIVQLVQDGKPYDVGEIVWRVGLPLSVLTLTLLAIPLSMVNPRASRSANLILALLVYFTYSNCLSLVKTWTGQQRIDFGLAWWVVHAAVVAIALSMLYWRNGVHRSWRAALRAYFAGRAQSRPEGLS